MTRDDGKDVWAIALSHYGAEQLQRMTLAHINAVYASSSDLDLPIGVSAEGLSEIVRSLLDDILAGHQRLLEGDRLRNRMHLQALLQLKTGLDKAILAELPAELLSRKLIFHRAQIDSDV